MGITPIPQKPSNLKPGAPIAPLAPDKLRPAALGRNGASGFGLGPLPSLGFRVWGLGASEQPYTSNGIVPKAR